MYESFQNKLQDNAESSDIFINKTVLILASYTRTIYYKYNRIPVFHHLPFAFMEINSNMGLFQHFVCVSSINCFFYLYVYIFLEIVSNYFIFGFCITLWNIYYLHLVWEDIENDTNRIVDFLINLWDSFQISF